MTGSFDVPTRLKFAVHLLLAAFAVALCWYGVSWSLRPGLYPIMDEIGNLTLFIHASYGQVITLFPHSAYNDRPFGFALAKLLYDIFGFDYHRALIFYLAFHAANCYFGFLLFRRLGVSVPLSIGAIGLYGGLWGSATTATYLGTTFDVLCLFFVLGSALAFLSEKRGATLLSAVLFLLALRTKEFAIMTPAVFAVLAWFIAPKSSLRQTLVWIAKRLWMHVVIGITIGLVYLSYASKLRADAPPSSPYYMKLDAKTVFDSFAYYTAMIFGQEYSVLAQIPVVVGLVIGAILVYSLIRRDKAVLFALAGFVLFLLPVSLLPNQRAPFYTYAPQMFLILLGCLLLERLFAVSKREMVRWVAAVAVALAMMSWTASFRRSAYFLNRVSFTNTVRSTTAVSAADALRLLPKVASGSHIYVNHGDQMPWLFVPGPCAFFQVLQKDSTIECVMNQPKDALRTLYVKDPGPKQFLDYKEDGSLTIADGTSN